MSFTLSNSEDMAHTSSDSDTKLTSNDTMNTQSKKSDDEVHVTSMKNTQKPFYVQNISGVHYDIAQDVACSPTPHSNHGCKKNNIRNKAIVVRQSLLTLVNLPNLQKQIMVQILQSMCLSH